MSKSYTQQWVFHKVKTFSGLIMDNIDEIENLILADLSKNKDHIEHENASVNLLHFIDRIKEESARMQGWAVGALELERLYYMPDEHAAINRSLAYIAEMVRGLRIKYVGYSLLGSVLEGGEDMTPYFSELSNDVEYISDLFARSERIAKEGMLSGI